MLIRWMTTLIIVLSLGFINFQVIAKNDKLVIATILSPEATAYIITGGDLTTHIPVGGKYEIGRIAILYRKWFTKLTNKKRS